MTALLVLIDVLRFNHPGHYTFFTNAPHIIGAASSHDIAVNIIKAITAVVVALITGVVSILTYRLSKKSDHAEDPEGGPVDKIKAGTNFLQEQVLRADQQVAEANKRVDYFLERAQEEATERAGAETALVRETAQRQAAELRAQQAETALKQAEIKIGVLEGQLIVALGGGK